MQKKDSPHEENLNVFREIAGSEVNCIYEDRKARLWVATGDGRVYMFDKDKVHWTSYNLFERIPKGKKKTSARLPSLRIFTMYQDQSGLMMFGTELGFVVLSEADKPGGFSMQITAHYLLTEFILLWRTDSVESG